MMDLSPLEEPRKEAFNLKLLRADSGRIRLLKQINNLDIFENPGSSNFHPDGLFSTEIFGRVGSKERDRTFAYIDLKTSILHPLVWKLLQRVKGLYHDILMGKAYATFNTKTKDFEVSDPINGQTGYAFFMEHWDELVIPDGASQTRKMRVKLLNQYRKESINEHILIMPAGLRDVEIDSLGRTKEGEINEHYRKLIMIVNTIGNAHDKNSSVFNRTRVTAQLEFNAIYDKIELLISGKRGFVNSKWAGRNIVNGTRNVLTAMDAAISDLDDKSTPTTNDTIAGLWQVSRGALPIYISKLKNGILSHVFGNSEGMAHLINKKTLRPEMVTIKPKTMDRWNTSEGLEQVIGSLSVIDSRHKPVEIEGHYLALVYRPKDRMVFKVFFDIEELPKDLDRADVYPISKFELIYLCNYRDVNKLACLPSRYPIEGEGSIYPSKIYLRTTVNSDARKELDDNWEETDDPESIAQVYPNFSLLSYIDTLIVPTARVAGMGADYDGDVGSLNILYTEEAINEINHALSTREAYINPAGGFRASSNTLITEFVMYNITGD